MTALANEIGVQLPTAAPIIFYLKMPKNLPPYR
jgi:hypothetical protein